MTAEQLITEYLNEVVGPAGPKRPRKKSLAQKQGARKGGRTRSRKQYPESAGWIYAHYYQQLRALGVIE